MLVGGLKKKCGRRTTSCSRGGEVAPVGVRALWKEAADEAEERPGETNERTGELTHVVCTEAAESVASLHERLLEGKMLLDEEMATLRLEAAKAPEKAAAGGRKSLAERMAEKHGIALSS